LTPSSKEPILILGIQKVNMAKAIGYVRVSTDKQADRGVSLDAQTEKIRAMAVVHGVELVDIIVDAAESAKSLNRPGMERLQALVSAGEVQTVIIAKLDRLTRSVKDLAELLERFQRRGVSLVSVSESLDTGSAAGRLVLNIMTAVSQWEREAIGERTAAAMQHKKSRRQVYNHTPYGFQRVGERLIPDPKEQEIAIEVRQMRASGNSLREIAGRLNERGIPSKQGGSWYASTVASLVNSSLYAAAS
jgi:site-specific DNA recombinase